MPEQNTRIVVVGAPKADKEFSVFVADREAVQRDIEQGRKTIEQVQREIERDLRQTTRGVRRGS